MTTQLAERPSPLQRLTLSRETLEATPARALKLLRGVGSSLVIRAILLQVGFTKADLEEGWQLLREACYLDDELAETASLDAASEALRTLDAWDERGIVLVQATLSHRYPSQLALLLHGVTPKDGAEAVLGVALLLDRLDSLERDPGREDTRDDDHAALALLAKRGLDPAERARLRAAVNTVRSVSGKPGSTLTEKGDDLARLTRLRAWYDEWSQIARVTLTRAEHLERMGLVAARG